MNISLVLVSADGKAREFALKKLPAVIGRGEECAIRIPLAAVSRQHCHITSVDDEAVVKDLKSSNGTYVNGERVRDRELVPGDLLAVGPVVFVVKIDGFPKEIDPVESYVAGAVEPGGADGGLAGGPAKGGTGTGSNIAGVPTWKDTSKAAGSAPKPGGGGGGAGKAPAGKAEDDDDDLDSLLKDLKLDDDD